MVLVQPRIQILPHRTLNGISLAAAPAAEMHDSTAKLEYEITAATSKRWTKYGSLDRGVPSCVRKPM